MRRLYLSDVDGTLTRGTPFPTDYTIKNIRELIKQGLNFTVATGRSLSSIIDFYLEMEGELPVVVLNGALVYDLSLGKAVKVFDIPQETLPKIFEAFKDSEIDCRMFVFDKTKQQVVGFRTSPAEFPYSKKINPHTGYKYEDIIVTDNLESKVSCGKVMYIGQNGSKEPLQRIYNQVSKLDGIQCTLQSNPYEDDNFYIDIFSAEAGKSSGAQVVSEFIGADEIITFGDNDNDICMLEKADRSYAVPDACEKVKAAAKYVLEDGSQDCVTKFIKKEFLKSRNLARV